MGGGGGKWAAVERRRWCERPGREWWSQRLGFGFQVRLKTWRFVGGHRRTGRFPGGKLAGTDGVVKLAYKL